jgi:hypothetical protein
MTSSRRSSSAFLLLPTLVAGILASVIACGSADPRVDPGPDAGSSGSSGASGTSGTSGSSGFGSSGAGHEGGTSGSEILCPSMCTQANTTPDAKLEALVGCKAAPPS